MKVNTFEKIIEAVSFHTKHIDFCNVRKCAKICVNNIERPDLNRTINDCYVLPLNDNNNSIIIRLSSDSNDIMIYKTVVENGICYGYDYCTYVDTKYNTQIETTAELMSVLPSIINSIIESEVTKK